MDRLHGKNILTRWIVNTGTSNHVTGDFSNMVNAQSIMECSVGLLDGRKSTINKEGTIILDGGLKLRHVLFVQFTNNLCVIQNRITLERVNEMMDSTFFVVFLTLELSQLMGISQRSYDTND